MRHVWSIESTGQIVRQGWIVAVLALALSWSAWAAEGGGAPDQAAAPPAAPQGSGGLLEMSLTDLMQISCVSASDKVEKVVDSPSNMTIITAQQIKEWGARDLKDVLRRVPGTVVIVDRDEMCISMRGMVSDNDQKYLILIDGHRINSVDNFGPGNIIELPNDLSNVKRIEIIRGPGSVVWGSGALSGVINIITMDAADLGPQKQQTSMTWGEDRTLKTNFNLGREYEKADWILHGAFADAKGHRVQQSAATSMPILDKSSGYSTHPFGVYTTAMDRVDDSWLLQFKGRYDRFSVNALALNSAIWNRHFEIGEGRDNWLTNQKYFVEPMFRDTIGDDWDFSWKGYYHYNDAKYENPRLDAAAAKQSFLRKSWKDASGGTKMTLGKQLTDQLAFNSGVEYTYTHTGPDNTTQRKDNGSISHSTVRFEDNNYDAYALFEYLVHKDVKLVFGSGADYNDDRGSKIWEMGPRAGVIWHTAPDLTQKLLYNRGFMRPAVFQLSGGYPVDSEAIDQFDYILMKQFGPASLTATAYWQKLKGFINIVAVGAASQWSNAGDFTQRGLELEFTTPIWRDHTFWANTSFCDATAKNFPPTLPLNSVRVDGGGHVLSYPEFTGNTGATFRFFDKKVFVSPALRYLGTVEYRETPPTTSSLDSATYRWVGPFAYVDLATGYEPNPNLGFYLTFMNLTDVQASNTLTIWNGTVGQSGRYVEFRVALKW